MPSSTIALPAHDAAAAAADGISVRYATYRDRSDSERASDASALRELRGVETVLLETCHRVELIALDGEPHDGPYHEVRGRDAVRRVFEVVAGFDSAVVAEEQLLGQVRTVYDEAMATRAVGPVLGELLRRAIRFGRRVRSHARPGSDRSLADRGVAWLVEHIRPQTRVIVAGTGEMGAAAANGLARLGYPVTVLSRSRERAMRLVQRLPPGDHAWSADDLTAELVGTHGALVVAVRSRAPLVRSEHLLAAELPWVVDLSSPAAAEPAAVARLADRLLDIDGLASVVGSEPVLAPQVERRLRLEVESEVERYVAWLETRRTSDAVGILHEEAKAVRERHMDKLRRRNALGPEQLALVERATASMLGELLHRPSAALRRGDADAAAVRRLFGIER